MPITETATAAPPLHLFLPCSGLDHVHRGFEVFMRECFEVLGADPALRATLVKGSGRTSASERKAWSIPRTNRLGAALSARVVGRPWFLEQVTFGIGLAPLIRRERPSVVFISERGAARMLHNLRQRGVLPPFTLVLSNSGPTGPPFPFADHIHQPTPALCADAAEAGEPASRQTLIPLARHIDADFRATTPSERALLRGELGLPGDRPIVLTVGAINRGHKRIDYLVGELAAMPAPRPYLVVLGQREPESDQIEAEATAALGAEGFTMRTVGKAEVEAYYRAADLFVLASLYEGFGLVYVEALAQGLPCVAHDFPTARFVLGEHGRFADLTQRGALARAMEQALAQPARDGDDEARHAHAHGHFSWDVLAPQYRDMLLRAGPRV